VRQVTLEPGDRGTEGRGSKRDWTISAYSSLRDWAQCRQRRQGHHGGAGNQCETSESRSRLDLIWSTDRTPADISIGEEVEDLGARIIGTAPPANGTRFAVIDFPPGNEPRMHRTETVDYVIVLAGEVEMDMDDSTVKLKAGDVMVQRGTNHAWANRSDKRARVAFVLVDAEPLGIGSPVTGGQSAR
jgi:quercetin dioxygenase-like cupin family protein